MHIHTAVVKFVNDGLRSQKSRVQIQGSILTSTTETCSLSRLVRDGGDLCYVPLIR